MTRRMCSFVYSWFFFNKINFNKVEYVSLLLLYFFVLSFRSFIAVGASYCDMLESIIRPKTSDFSSQCFSLNYFTLSLNQSSLYRLIVHLESPQKKPNLLLTRRHVLLIHRRSSSSQRIHFEFFFANINDFVQRNVGCH